MARRVLVTALAVTVVAVAIGLAGQRGRAVAARTADVGAAIVQLRLAGVDGATVDGLTRRLDAIRGERWGPLPRAWLPAPLTGLDVRLRALRTAVDEAGRAALATARQDARGALQQLAAADPGLPAAELASYRTRVEGAATPAQLRPLTGEVRAAATTAARQRQPVLDLAPRADGLRQLVAGAAGLGVDTGQAGAALAAYDALVSAPAREVGDRAGTVAALLDQASQSLGAAIEEARRPPAPAAPPAPPAPVRQGRSVLIDLGDQRLYAYRDGVPFISTPVTTGRPALPTGQGTFHVIFKRSPYEFISPWPRSSPYYYPPAWTTWAVEFIGDGTFLHDAPWQPDGTYGPGSQNGPYASHGCVHVPAGTMATLYEWLQPGDTVVVQP